MKNILVTAGGTIEPVDDARCITNTGTGRLGSLVADELAARKDAGEIIYLCSHTALRPRSDRVKVVEIGSVEELRVAAERIISRTRIDAIVHSMAVSDYSVKSVTTLSLLAEHLTGDSPFGVCELDPEMIDHEDGTPQAAMEAGLYAAITDCDIRRGGAKLSSKMKAPVILLQPTPKILPLLRQWAPDALIIGFKLMTSVSLQTLTETAKKLLEKNGCDYVLANDLSQISGDSHRGYLTDKNGIAAEFSTKQEIAAGIADVIFGGDIL